MAKKLREERGAADEFLKCEAAHRNILPLGRERYVENKNRTAALVSRPSFLLSLTHSSTPPPPLAKIITLHCTALVLRT